MNPEQFAYWLQGWIELSGGKIPTEHEWNLIVEHLNAVFVKITSELGQDDLIPAKPNFEIDFKKFFPNPDEDDRIQWPSVTRIRPQWPSEGGIWPYPGQNGRLPDIYC